jgi:hypothetical protein
LKLKKIVDALPSLQKLSAADLSLKCLYWVRKLINKLEPELKFYSEERGKIIEKYRDPDVKDTVKFKPWDIADVNKDIEELLDIDIEANFTVPVVPESEDIKLSVNDLAALTGFVDFVFDADTKESKKESKKDENSK